MKHAREYLAAGALLPPGLRIKSDIPVDPVGARIYNHPALGDAPVVRLTPDNLAKGDDLEMEFLGFSRSAVKKRVAKQKRHALGFPGWALINDPEHAKYALKVVKRLKKGARKAKSKPGHAQDMFLEIAGELGRGVPAFLPSYWEEVGRIFIHLGNATYAARAFGKAREAEKVHALNPSLEEQGAAFVEFALCGALSIKTLNQHAKDLQESASPRAAWEQLGDICIKRTLGGLPPWAAMARDMRRWMKAAGVDVKKEEKAFIKAVVESPAVSKAPESFWKDYKKTIADMVVDAPRLGACLLNLFPEIKYECFVMTWIEFLDEWGLLENLGRKKFGPKDGVVPWLNTLFKQWGESWGKAHASPLLLDLLEKNADNIKKDGRPLVLIQGRWNKRVVGLDVLERCLQLKIAVDETETDFRIDLSEWAKLVETAPDRLQDPILTRNHPVFGRVLEGEIGQAIGEENFEKACIGKPVLQKLRKEWLLDTISSFSDQGMIRAGLVVELLAEKTGAPIFKENPEAHSLLCTQETAVALQTTLRGGVLDEFGWPELEKAVRKLNPDGKKEIDVSPCAPFVVLSDTLTVLVVGPGGIVLEHDLRTPSGYTYEKGYYFDGDLLVRMRKKGYGDDKAYWAAAPDDLFTMEYEYIRDTESMLWQRDDGCFTGSRLVRSGQPVKTTGVDSYFSDGEHVWKIEYDYGRKAHIVFEFDFRTGEKGRPGMPSFFEDFIPGSRAMDFENSWLYAPGAYAASSPLGEKDGLTGWRVRREEEGGDIELTCEGVDGRSVSLTYDRRIRSPRGLTTWPGDGKHRLIGSSRYGGFSIFSLDGLVEYSDPKGQPLHATGQPFHLPLPFWHAFTPRDPEGSKILLTISKKACSALLAAAEKELPPGIGGRGEPGRKFFSRKKWPETLEAVNILFRHKANPLLARGVLGVVQHAAVVERRLKKLTAARNPDMDNAEGLDEILRSVLEEGLSLAAGKSGPHYYRPNIEGLFMLMALLRKDIDDIEEKETSFFSDVMIIRALPLIIIPRLFEAEKTDLLADFLDAWARAGIVEEADRMRVTHASASETFEPPFPTHKIQWKGHMGIGESGGHVYVLFSGDPKKDKWLLFEYSPDEAFRDLPGLISDSSEPVGSSWSREDYRLFAGLMREKGEPPISVEAISGLAERTGLTYAEASLLWCGFPGQETYEKNFLPKSLRERLGLKVNEAYAARGNLSHFGDDKLGAVLFGLSRPDLAEIWDPDNGRYAGKLAEAWSRVIGKALQVPAGLNEKLQEELEPSVSLHQLSNWISDVASPLHVDYNWTFASLKHPGAGEGVIPDAPADDDRIVIDPGQIMDNVSALIPFLFESLPAGEPIRELAPKLLELTLARLSHPGLLVFAGARHGWDDRKAIDSLVRHFIARGARERRSSEDKARGVVYETEAILGIYLNDDFSIAFRPALVTSEQDKAFLLGPGCLDSTRIWRRVEFFLSGRLKAFCDRIVDTPLPDGGWENNPLLGAPEVVDKAAALLDLDREAAALYLQHLALAAPTRKNILLWNGWKPAMYKKHIEQLCKKELLLEAKRRRAGRNHFLPGGWEDLKAPLLPLETWKLPLFELERNDAGKLVGPYIRPGRSAWDATTAILPVLPSHELFARAWRRVEEGDPPRYEDVS